VIACWCGTDRIIEVVSGNEGIPFSTGEIMTIDTLSHSRLAVHHVAKGTILRGEDVVHTSRDRSTSFVTPRLDMDQLIWSRSEPFPAFDVSVSEVIDFLVETGGALDIERNEHLKRAVEGLSMVNVLSRRVLEERCRSLWRYFDPVSLSFDVEESLRSAYDHWRFVEGPNGSSFSVRACPARLVHVMAGNGVGVAAATIVRGALSRGVHLLKLPSNDLFSAPAILATMADIDPTHPVLRSFSAAYWRGGDQSIESIIYRPQFFDKIVAWGGEAGIRNVQRYLGPGLELVSMDPKTSISLIGREAFTDDETLSEVAELAARDVGTQQGCVDSRHQFVEGTVEQVDAYCEALVGKLGIERATADARGPATPEEIRDEVEVLRQLEPAYRAWGGYDGSGLVVRSEEPVDFHPVSKTVNVVQVDDLAEAIAHVNVATQTVGVFPAQRRIELRDRLVCAGAQRIVGLGGVPTRSGDFGKPHDGMYILHRMVRWVRDDG
jgi:hypothetical protein